MLNRDPNSAHEQYRQACDAGLDPETIANAVFEGIRSGRFYLLTHPEFNEFIRVRMDGILQTGNPLPLAELAEMLEG